jgi:hypothetical protein
MVVAAAVKGDSLSTQNSLGLMEVKVLLPLQVTVVEVCVKLELNFIPFLQPKVTVCKER